MSINSLVSFSLITRAIFPPLKFPIPYGHLAAIEDPLTTLLVCSLIVDSNIRLNEHTNNDAPCGLYSVPQLLQRVEVMRMMGRW